LSLTSQNSTVLSLVRRLHGSLVFNRRVRVLARALAAQIPPDSSVLDIGCGDGAIASLLRSQNPTVRVQGIEVAPRADCLVECKAFDGTTIPHASGSFDVCMLIDVLHHAHDIQALLKEASRVSARYVLVKDHLAESRIDLLTLKFMDWVGNRPHGVVVPYRFQSRAQWREHFFIAGLRVVASLEQLPLYPFPFSAVFGRKLHYLALLEESDLQHGS
jgi:SAM-dependent methyltransferase